MKKKRLLALFAAIAMLVAIIPPVSVLADGIIVEVPCEEIGKMVEPDKAVINVTTSGQECEVTYECPELGIESTTVSVPKGEDVYTIPLKGILNGFGTLKVKVSASGETITEGEHQLIVFPKYEPQFMDKYMERYVGNHYSQGGQSDEKDTYMLQRAGVQRIRDDMGWSMLENGEKGNWTYEWTDRFLNDLFEMGIETTPLIYGNNNLYFEGKPTTSEDLTGYATFIEKMLERYPHIKAWEDWNEPNLGGWNAVEYMKTVKVNANLMRREDYNTEILGGSINSTDTVFLKTMLEDRAFAFVDYISYHPYITPNKTDDHYRNYINKMDDVILDYGGWKESFVTEIGWPTHDSPQGNTMEEQSVELVKMYIIGDSMGAKGNSMYVFKDCGDDERNVEDRFGFITRDATPKLSYLSFSQLMQELNGGIHMGDFYLNNTINAHVYVKDKKPIVAMWTTYGNGETTYDFGEEVEVVDMYGNPVAPTSGNTYKFTEDVFYVKGVDDSWVTKAVKSNLEKDINEINDRFGDKIGTNLAIPSLSNFKDEAEIVKAIDELYSYGDYFIRIPTFSSDIHPFLSTTETSAVIYLIQKAGINLFNLYAYVTETDDGINSTTAKEEVYNQLMANSKADLDGMQIYTEAIYRYAKRLTEKAIDIYNTESDSPAKLGVAMANDKMADKLYGWAKLLMKYEPITHTSFSIEVPEGDTTLFEGEVKDITVGIRSFTDKDTEGVIKLYDPEGNLVAESEKIQVKNGEVTSITLPVLFNYEFGGQKADFVMELDNNGVILDHKLVRFKSEEKVAVTMEPLDCVVEDVKEIKVNLTNLYTKPLTGKITVEAPQGWELENNNAEYSLDVDGTTSVTFAVKKTEKYPFNYYTFGVRLKDVNMGEVITTNVPQTFLVIVKNTDNIDVTNYKGEIENWADAYPIFVKAPKYSNSIDEWRTTDVAGMTFLKWDEDYFYVLSNVYDDAYVQQSTGYGIWGNDNIQFALDTLNDKSENGYATDDYEIGMAYTPQGREMYAWYTAEGVEGGQWDPNMTHVIRDEDLNCTRYIVKLPKANCSPLPLKEGTEFGFNIGLNDADVSQREEFPQLTSGLCDYKKPALYYTFKLIGDQEAADLSGVEKYKLPIEFTIDWENSFKNFSDISVAILDGEYYIYDDVTDHWARKDIENMSKRGIVDGVGNRMFEPERNITRAEFIALLAKAGITPTEYNGGLNDVKADDWFAGYVQTGINAKIIPEEMIVDGAFSPETPITREEMAAMVVNMYNYKADIALTEGESIFADEGEFTPWTVKYINAAAKAGIVNGVEDNMYNAKANSTRAEAVVIVKRLLSKI